jgi:hypothetical protein
LASVPAIIGWREMRLCATHLAAETISENHPAIAKLDRMSATEHIVSANHRLSAAEQVRSSARLNLIERINEGVMRIALRFALGA